MAAPSTQRTASDAEAQMRAAFEARLRGIIQGVAAQAELTAIAGVLAEPSSMGAIAQALGLALTLNPPGDPLAAARARGVATRERLIERAGGLLRAGEAAERLGVTRAAVHARKVRGTMLAVPLANGEMVYPACQFTEAGVVQGLGTFLQAFGDQSPWMQLGVLLAPSARHGGLSALELLGAGEVEAAVGIARRHGEHLG